MNFTDRLVRAIEARGTLLCVGLDPDPDRLPAGVPQTPEGVLEFLLRIIETTREHAAAYKPNAAFFESMGHEGMWILEEVRRAIPEDHIAILDAKRGDISNTARMYARAAFDRMGFDAITVNPYLGRAALLPFLERPDRGAFVLCRTSNPGADEVQMVRCGGVPLYIAIARMVAEMDGTNAGLVVGATAPEALVAVREAAPGIPLLIPGVGAQGGDLAAAVAVAEGGPVLINASRSIIFASSGPDHAEAAGRAAGTMADEMRRLRGR